ncbi:MAG TPA: hypothetical protein VES38_06830 [Methylotenera sp.]|nr:hypothetical protein [Methylotenera sp.]
MATGASKAKREVRKQMASAYFEALSKTERANQIKKIDTQSARKLSDQMNGEMSYDAKRLAMKADKVGRAINADKTLNQDIEAYNKRFDEMKRQMKGEAVQKFEVVKNTTGLSNGIADLGAGLIKAIRGETAIGKYDDSEKASAEIANIKPKKQNTHFMMGIGNGLSYIHESARPDQLKGFADVSFGQMNDPPEYIVRETNLTPISGNYRQLSGTQGAYKDLEKLSKNVGNNPVSALTQDYEGIANKLRSKLKRDVGNASAKPAGLLDTELARASPTQEVIA